MTDRDKMDEAIELVGRGHSRGSAAQNQHGEPCDPRLPTAAAWCMFGAVDHVTQCDADAYARLAAALRAEGRARGVRSEAAFSDSAPTPAVLDFMRAARGRL